LENIFFGDPAFIAAAGDGFELVERDAFAGGDIENKGGIETVGGGAVCGWAGLVDRLVLGGLRLGMICGGVVA